MFRKLVSSLPFSPALVGQLGFYAKRLRKEQFTRRLGLFFTALALIVQSFAVFTPPEQALASSGSDVIPGGVRTVQDILNYYDAGAKGQNDFKDFMDYFGITRAQLAAMNPEFKYICSSDHDIISFGRKQHYSAAEGTLQHNIPRQTGGFSTFFSVPLFRFDSVNNKVNCYDAFIGNSPSVGGWFAIMRKCGNFQIKQKTQKVPKGHFVAASCKSVQGWAYDERQTDLKVNVYLYFNGPPGKGQQYGPIASDQSTPSASIGGGYGFTFAVPEQYQKSKTPTQVWAVMQPLPGWNQPNVQFDNTVTIPGNCTPTETPVVQCMELRTGVIDRNHFSLSAKAHANQATITGYLFTVTDKSGKKVYEKLVSTAAELAKIDSLELKTAGDYTVKVVVKTSIGDIESPTCIKTLKVCPEEKCIYSDTISKNDENCKPCPYDKTLWIKDEKNCRPQISESKEAKNLTKNVADANNTTAKTSDRIEFTIYTTNVGSGTVTTSINEDLSDVLEYSDVFQNGGGTFDSTSKVLSWGDVTLGPQQTDVRKFVVQVKDKIPATPRGANNPAAFNCLMTNSYGNTINIHVECPLEKQIEGAVKELPSTGTSENIVFATILAMVVTYFYARSRQMNKEVKLIRKEFNSGTI